MQWGACNWGASFPTAKRGSGLQAVPFPGVSTVPRGRRVRVPPLLAPDVFTQPCWLGGVPGGSCLWGCCLTGDLPWQLRRSWGQARPSTGSPLSALEEEVKSPSPSLPAAGVVGVGGGRRVVQMHPKGSCTAFWAPRVCPRPEGGRQGLGDGRHPAEHLGLPVFRVGWANTPRARLLLPASSVYFLCQAPKHPQVCLPENGSSG